MNEEKPRYEFFPTYDKNGIRTVEAYRIDGGPIQFWNLEPLKDGDGTEF